MESDAVSASYAVSLSLQTEMNSVNNRKRTAEFAEVSEPAEFSGDLNVVTGVEAETNFAFCGVTKYVIYFEPFDFCFVSFTFLVSEVDSSRFF